MDNDTSARSTIPASLNPLVYWHHGFEYAFGFQLKLLLDFWGLNDHRQR